jgi:isocitrate dehydrogenase
MALEKARKEFTELKKSGVNKFFKTSEGEPHKYSTLNDIFTSCREALMKNDLNIIYNVIYEDGMNFLITKLCHLPSGQKEISKSILGNSTITSQAMGSAITYMRRYHIQAMLNLEGDFEDDGNAASVKPAPTQQPKQQPTNQSKGGL